MPRGGARPGSGPSPDPNSARSRARAARVTKADTPRLVGPLQVAPVLQAATTETQVPAATKPTREQPLDIMFRLMECGDPRIELQAAIAAAPYVHPKLMPTKAKADEKKDKPSRFATPLGPRLVTNK